MATLLTVCASPAAAADAGDKDAARAAEWTGAIFVMNGTEAQLPTVPFKLVTGQLPFNDSQLVAAAVSYRAVPRFDLPLLVTTLRGVSLDLEAQTLQHFGDERSAEVTGAVILRSPQFGITNGTSANVAWGNGLSYALTPPTAEFGRSGVRGVDTVRFQSHMSFETELTSSANSSVHYVLRLHHRSGIYGVISPQKTGSNYLGIGVRIDLARRN